MALQYLLENVNIDTDGTSVAADGANKTLVVWATNFGGGTVTIECSPDGGVTWITLTSNGIPVAYTSNNIALVFRIGSGLLVRGRFAGSAGASNVNMVIAG